MNAHTSTHVHRQYTYHQFGFAGKPETLIVSMFPAICTKILGTLRATPWEGPPGGQTVC